MHGASLESVSEARLDLRQLPARCFHCGEPVPEAARHSVRIDGIARAMCCAGCAAVAQTIVDYGLERYYRMRSDQAPRPESLLPRELERLRVYDAPALQQQFVEHQRDGHDAAALILERVSCPACCWLIERRLRELPGVTEARVDYTVQRARVRWQPAHVRLSTILETIAALGYGARPFTPQAARAAADLERRTQLRRLALAGLFGMQVMMISVALYFGAWSGIDDTQRRFLQWAALLLTLPLLLDSATPFFANAWRDLRALRTGMDLPVALGILIAFAGSVYATLTGSGPVYYDSVSMFVFLLLGGRYLEFSVRRKLAQRLDLLYRVEPARATRLQAAADGAWLEQELPAAELAAGDRVLVRPGELVPGDGIILEGETTLDESLLSGESRPVQRAAGQRVIGGSGNLESPIQLRIERIGADTVLAQIRRLAERGRAEKPALTEFANRIGGWFVGGVLLLCAIAAGYWLRVDPQRCLPVIVSMLVITCPCALALASPTALAAATAALLRRGLLVTRANAVETLARATLFAFDKTGTLTRGEPVLGTVRVHGKEDAATCLRLAAALEAGSDHPLARALRRAAPAAMPAARGLRHLVGAGVEGEIAGRRYFLGNRAFIGLLPGMPAASVPRSGSLFLAAPDALLAEFDFEDELRPDAARLIEWLRRRGRRCRILSGDDPAVVEAVAARLALDAASGAMRPADKQAALRAARAEGEIVCMVGDGVNDAPVLAAAHVSVAMGGGTDLAQSHADLILLDNRLESLRRGIALACRTLAVMRQNAGWAIAYNLLALPLAAGGWVPPWLAALGMAASSLLVTANSARLARDA